MSIFSDLAEAPRSHYANMDSMDRRYHAWKARMKMVVLHERMVMLLTNISDRLPERAETGNSSRSVSDDDAFDGMNPEPGDGYNDATFDDAHVNVNDLKQTMRLFSQGITRLSEHSAGVATRLDRIGQTISELATDLGRIGQVVEGIAGVEDTSISQHLTGLDANRVRNLIREVKGLKYIRPSGFNDLLRILSVVADDFDRAQKPHKEEPDL